VATTPLRLPHHCGYHSAADRADSMTANDHTCLLSITISSDLGLVQHVTAFCLLWFGCSAVYPHHVTASGVPSAHCATISSQHVWPSGIFCRRSDCLEPAAPKISGVAGPTAWNLLPQRSAGSNVHHRQFEDSAEDSPVRTGHVAH